MPISYEGANIVTANGGNENGTIAQKGESVTITPIVESGTIDGTVVHNSAVITDILNSQGQYTLTTTEYHNDNTIYSYGLAMQNVFDITVAQGGEVLDIITVSNVPNVYKLKITGNINGTDIAAIRRMENLKVLDLSAATIVSGGNEYYNNCTTSNYVVGDNFFSGMASLEVVQLPNNAVTIGSYAFDGCTGLKSITIPASVTFIGDYAFQNCTNLKTVSMKDGTGTIDINGTEISSTPFYNCPLTNLYIGRNFNYNYSPFKNKVKLTSLTIGDEVTNINSEEFYGCIGLEEVSIPYGVTSIMSNAFNGCTGLKTLIMEDNAEVLSLTTTSSANPFLNCPIETLYLGRTLSYEYSPFKDMTSLNSLTISDDVTYIGTEEFYGCIGLKSFTIPTSITSIGSYAFYGCSQLVTVKTPCVIQTIGDYSFYGCTNMKTLSIGDSCTTIGSYAFAGCSELEEIESRNPSTPDIESNTFDEVDKNMCVLYVPEGSLNTYWVHIYWGEFYNIKEGQLSDDVGNIQLSDNISANHGNVKIYNISGNQLNTPRRGEVNIFEYPDVTTKKVLAK